MANIRAVSEFAKKYDIPVVLDSARLAENAYFIKTREPGYENKPIKEITREMFSYCETATMSSKKDGLVNIGGLIVTRNDEFFTYANQMAIVHEGFITYGGMSGRDMEALAELPPTSSPVFPLSSDRIFGQIQEKACFWPHGQVFLCSGK